MQYNVTGISQQVNALYQNVLIKQNQLTANFSSSQNFTLPKNFSVELSGFYNSRSLGGIAVINGMVSFDAGVKKKLPKKAGSLTFNAVNILNTSVFGFGTNLPEQNLITKVYLRYAFPTFKLTYTHSFGKKKGNVQQVQKMKRTGCNKSLRFVNVIRLRSLISVVNK